MKRKPNKNPRSPDAQMTEVIFTKGEMLQWRRVMPPPSGSEVGGAGRFQNWLMDNTDPTTGVCKLDPIYFQRMKHYATPMIRKGNIGPGGPNSRIRSTCIPALRRIGVDLLPEWRAP